MPKQDVGVVKRVIVTPDKHFPYHAQDAINVLNKTIEIVKPDAYIDLGDVGEWSAFSHWKYKRRIAPPLEYLIPDFDKDVEDVNAGMDMIDEALDKVGCKEKYITEGNHDNWLILLESFCRLVSYFFIMDINMEVNTTLRIICVSYAVMLYMVIGMIYNNTQSLIWMALNQPGVLAA